MQDPFATLSEAGFSSREGLGMAEPGDWTPELIASLDWMRLAELVRAIATQAGCELAGSRVLPDGAVVFGMIERPTTAFPQRALVKISGWNEWGATPESVAHFAQEVRTAQNTRGILIAPAGFSPAAIRVAQEQRIETVDSTGLSAVLHGFSTSQSDFLYTIATAGLFSQPTCPVCLKKLSRVDFDKADRTPAIRVIREVGLYADQVTCDLLDIAPGAEVNFLYPVEARAMRVSGHASGVFTCEGTVTIEAGGLLDGQVAARSVNVREGGELRAQFRILESSLEPFAMPPERWQWRCQNPEGGPGCSQVVFDPHG